MNEQTKSCRNPDGSFNINGEDISAAEVFNGFNKFRQKVLVQNTEKN